MRTSDSDSSLHSIPIRIMDFQFDIETVKRSLPSFFLPLGLSMTLPYLEPYLIRTMQVALAQVTDKKVADEVKQFIGQEAQHYRQHKKLNDLIRQCYPDGGLEKLEAQMEADYQRFSKTKSLKFNLAYAEGFEAATCASARNEMRFREFENIDAMQGNEIIRLYQWHQTEEVEHRTVTFDIYQHLYGDYFYRLFVGMYGQYHFFKYVFRFASYMKKHLPEDCKPVRLRGPSGKATMALILDVLKTYLPTYNPRKIELHENFSTLKKRFLNEAVSVRGE
jgi:uncharacterized protein